MNRGQGGEITASKLGPRTENREQSSASKQNSPLVPRRRRELVGGGWWFDWAWVELLELAISNNAILGVLRGES